MWEIVGELSKLRNPKHLIPKLGGKLHPKPQKYREVSPNFPA